MYIASCKMENLFIFDKKRALVSNCKQVLVRKSTIGMEYWYLEEASCWCWERFLKIDFPELLPSYARNWLKLASYGQLFLFGSNLQRFPCMGSVFFLRYLVQVFTLLFFSHLFRINSPDNLSHDHGTLFHLSDFLRHAV